MYLSKKWCQKLFFSGRRRGWFESLSLKKKNKFLSYGKVKGNFLNKQKKH